MNGQDLNSVPQYAGRPLDVSFEPVILKKSQAQYIEETLKNCLKQIDNFTSEISKDRRQLKLLNLPEDLDLTPTPLGLHIPFARFDFLFDGENISALELNTDGTSGYNVTEWLTDQAQIKESENPNFKLSERLLKAIQDHDPKAKEVCLVDFEGIGTSWEQLDLLKRWKPLFNSHFSNPKYKTWHDGALCYRRALSWQLRSQPEKAKAFLDDWKNKKITVVGGWSSDVGMSKAWPALLKPKCFPETVLLNEVSVKKITDEKDQWIIKGSSLSYSGNALFRGIDLKQEKWSLCVAQALTETTQGRHWIGQRRIEVPLYEGKPYELGLYFLNGKPSGYMCRWGSSKSISETSDEILRPVKIIS